MINTNQNECPICGGMVKDNKCCACGYILSDETGNWRIEREKYVDAKELDTCADTETGFTPVDNGNRQAQSYEAVSFYQNPSAPIPLNSTNIPIVKERQGYKVGVILGSIAYLLVCSLIMLIFAAVSVVALEDNYEEAGTKNVSYDHNINNNDSDNSLVDDDTNTSNGSANGLSEETLKRYGYYYGTMSDFIVDHISKIEVDSQELKDIAYTGENPLAYEFMDCVPKDLPYTLTRNYYHYNNEDDFYNDANNYFPEMLIFDSSYIKVAGTDSINEEAINEALLKESAKCVEVFDAIRGYLYEDSTFRINVSNYVTYADEDTLSVLQSISGYIIRDGEEYHYSSILSSINIDIKLAKVIDKSEVLSISKEFYASFAQKCEAQNGSAVSMTTEELVTMFDAGRYVWVYTPLGIEIGVNYGEFDGQYDGWATCTYTDLSEIISGY